MFRMSVEMASIHSNKNVAFKSKCKVYIYLTDTCTVVGKHKLLTKV